MDEWQNRLRAQKEQDRKNKSQSAEILHNYRGGTKEEDEILKKIREDDRKKKADAENSLRDYRPSADAIQAQKASKPSTPTKHDGPLPPVVQAPTRDDPRNSIAAGAVSSIAANFTGSSMLSDPTTPTKQSSTNNRAQEDGASKSSASEMNWSFTDVANTNDMDNDNEHDHDDTAQDWVQVTSEEVNSEEGPMDSKATSDMGGFANDNDKTNINSSTDANEEMAGEDATNAPMVDFDTPEYFPKQSETIDMTADVVKPKLSRSNVNFSFGLISTKTHPSLEAYMEAVQQVVQTALDENKDMAEQISLDPNWPPFVKELKNDESFSDPGGRSNIHRVLVRAVVPVFLAGEITTKKARSFLLRALAQALRNGYFLEVGERV